MPPEIRAADDSELGRIVALHAAAFGSSFLTSLGPRFLASYYRTIMRSVSGAVLVAYADRDLVGVAAGSFRPHSLYRDLLGSRRSLARDVLPALARRPGLAVRLAWAYAATRERGVRVPERAGELASLAVDPGVRRLGVGQQLVTEFARRAAEAGCDRVYVRTPALDNDGVLTFYRRLGFEPGPRWDDRGREMVLLQRSLASDRPEGAIGRSR